MDNGTLTPIGRSVEFKALGNQLNTELEKVKEKFALKYLEYFRRRLLPFNTSRHTITILAAMGSASLMIDDRHFHDFPMWRKFPISTLLNDIEDALDWDFAAYLDGKKLN